MRDNSLMIKLVDTAMHSAWEIKKEALWTLSNICTTGSDDHVKCLVQGQGIEPIADVLSTKNADATILAAALDAIQRILDVGERYSEDYAKMFDECNGIDHLEGLQEHNSNQVYEKAVHIIETYFGGEEQEDENLAPVTSAAGTFEFGISSPKQLFPTQGAMSAGPTTFQFGVANRAI
jgi:importin subunit alpha-1